MNYDQEIEKYYHPENFEPLDKELDLHEYQEEFLNNPDENKPDTNTNRQENS